MVFRWTETAGGGGAGHGGAGQRDLLQFFGFGTGIQVFLDGELLYTDFPNEENRADSFLEDVDFSSISHDGLCIPLPIDCAGKTLRIVTYDTALNGLLYPTFPSLVSRFSDSVTAVSGIVWPMAVITAQVILALFLLLVFLFSAQTGPYLWKLLPLSGYFLLTGGACGVRLILRTFCRIGYNGQPDGLALSHLY